jgi:para-nitrobenzyl esterase
MREIYGKYGKNARAMLMGDSVFRLSSLWYAQVCGKYSNTWMYRFDYATPAMRLLRLRAFHSCDIPYVFGNMYAGNFKWMFSLFGNNRKTKRVVREVQHDFASFIKYGKAGWQKCGLQNTNAKCYDRETAQKPMVEPEIVAAFDATEYKRRSFTGIKINYSHETN